MTVASVLLARLAGVPPASETVARVRVDMNALAVETHCIVLARLPAARRKETVAAITQHPTVLACDQFEGEPMDILLEVAAGNGHHVQDLITWAKDLFGMQVHDILPVEHIVRGGPEQPPDLTG